MVCSLSLGWRVAGILRLDKIHQFGVDFIIDSTRDFEQSLYEFILV